MRMKERYGTVYAGKQILIDAATGEKIEVDKVYRKQTESHFVKAYISQLVLMLDIIGNKKIKVINYILDNVTLANNIIIATNREIAKKTKVSYKTVADTLKALEEANIIKRKTGVIMLNPSLLVRGDDIKRRHLLIEFEKFDDLN